jgi:DNA-binding winged helix-turn-helix (wHTH) protein/Flp pilus assembly protein TadD
MSDIATTAAVVLAQAAPFRLGALAVRPATREVVAADWREVLEPRVMQVLVALARTGGEVVGRDELTQTCWDGRVVSEDAINRVIARLRRLSEQGEGQWFTLETITKVGYRLVSGAVASPPNQDAAAKPMAQSLAEPRHPGRRRWVLRAVLTGIVIAAITGVFLFLQQPPALSEAVAVDYRNGVQAMNAGTADDSAHAIALLQSVVDRAPDYAPGWSSLSLAYLISLEYVPPEARDGVLRRADAAWNKALELDPHDPGGQAARYALTSYPDLESREKAQIEILADAPDQTNMLLSRAGFLRQVGRYREAVDFGRRGADLDGASPRSRGSVGRMLAASGQIEEADRVLGEAARLWPRNTSIYFTRVWVYMESGRAQQALAMLDDRAQRPAGVPIDDFVVYRTAALAFYTRNSDDVKAALVAFGATVPQGYGYAQNAMMVQSALGDLDAAFRTADALYRGKGIEIAPMMFSPVQGQYVSNRRGAMHVLFSEMTAAMRADPRFLALVTDLGLMAYWRNSGTRPDVCKIASPPPFCAAIAAP